MRFQCGLLVVGLAASSAFTPPTSLPTSGRAKATSSACPQGAARGSTFSGFRRQQVRAPLGLAMAADPIQKIKEGDSKMAEVEKKLSNCAFWSCPPSVCTMYTDDPEYFQMIQGRVEVTPCTIQGKLTGEPVEFGEGDFGIVPAGSHRWEIIRPTTKQTSCREGLQLTTKGWREEPPLKSMRGKGTLSTNGRNCDDDLKYLKELIADKGPIPASAWETAISYKMDRDIYLANLSFMVTDKGIIVMDRVSERILDVLDATGFVGYDENLDYIETEGSKRWRKDGTFDRNRMMLN